jgi:cell division protein FtsB
MPRRRAIRTERPALAARLPIPRGLGHSGARLVTLALIGLSLWLLSSFVGQVITGAQMDRRAAELQGEIGQLEAERNQLATQVAYAESPAYAEKIAREQLGYARDGDTVVLPTLPEATPTPAVPTPAPIAAPPREANWRAWLHALFP